MQGNTEIRETQTTFFSSGTKRLLIFFYFQFFDTIFTMLTVPPSLFSSLPSGTLGPESESPLASPRDESQLASSSVQSELTAFFKNHQNYQPIASGHDVIHTLVSFPIWGFYYDICDCHILCARALSRTVLSLTKPNDKT